MIWSLLRALGVLLVGASAIAFVTALIKLVMLPGAYHCIGPGCPYQTPQDAPVLTLYAPMIPISIVTFFVGVCLVVFARPSTVIESDTASALSPDALRSTHSRSGLAVLASSWSAWNRNGFLAIGLFELALAGFFLWVAQVHTESAGGMYLTAGILGVVGVALLIAAVQVHAGYMRSQHVLASGVDGEATVLAVSQPNMYMNGNPLLDIEMEIRVPGWQPYRVRHREYVPLAGIGLLEVGHTVPIKVDPDDHTSFRLPWDPS